MTSEPFDYGYAEPYLESARVALESHGFRFEGGCASGASLAEYRFKTPNRRTSICVQAPVTLLGQVRRDGWRWSPYAKPAGWTHASTVETMVVQVLGRLAEFS